MRWRICDSSISIGFSQRAKESSFSRNRIPSYADGEALPLNFNDERGVCDNVSPGMAANIWRGFVIFLSYVDREALPLNLLLFQEQPLYCVQHDQI